MIDLIVYLEGGYYKLKECLPTALCVYLVWLVGTLLFSRESVRNIPLQCARMLWVIWLVLLLEVKGILDFDSGKHMTYMGDYVTSFSFELFSPNGLDGRRIGIMDLLNVLLYIPFGYLTTAAFGFIKRNFLTSFIFAVIMTSTLEGYQCILGRNAQLDDIITNTIGFVVGRFGFFAFRELWDTIYYKAVAMSTTRR